MNGTHESRNEDWTAIARYLAGEMPSPERLAFEEWIAERPALQREIALARRLWDDAAMVPAPADVERMWRTVISSITPRRVGAAATPIDVSTGRRPIAGRRPSLSMSVGSMRARWVGPAAIVAGALLLLAVTVADQRRERAVLSHAPLPVREFRTEPGQRATIQLKDGSRVELGVASVLTVAPFTDSSRNVTLTGEAIFDVVHDPGRPFRVHSANAITEDIGTRFGVRAYSEDRNVRVVVTEGAVAIRTDVPSAARRLLRARDLALVDRLGAITLRSGVDTTRYLSWTNSRLVLRNERLRDAAIELARWHDTPVTVVDSQTGRMRITVDMRLGTLEESLRAVTVPLGLRYSIADSGAVIRP